MNRTILKKQRVRILATDELGTVAEKVFIKRQGGQRPELYCRVWLDKKPKEDRWYWGSELGGTKETAKAVFTAGNSEIRVDVTLDHETQTLKFNIIGTPENLKEHNGLHAMMAAVMITHLSKVGGE